VSRLKNIITLIGISTAVVSATLIYIIDRENPYIWIINFLLLIMLVLKHLRNPPIFIFFIFLIPYFCVPFYFFQEEMNISFWSSYQTAGYLNHVTLTSLLFIAAFSATINRTQGNQLPLSSTFIQPNILTFLVCSLLCLVILHFGISGENIFTSTYGHGDVEKSTMHEYFIIPFLGLILSRKASNLIQEFFILSLMLTYAAKTLIYGGRIEVLQISLLYIYMHTNFLKHMSTWKLIATLMLGYFALSTLGLFRASAASGSFPDGITQFFDYIFQSDSKELGYISSTAGDVTHASMRILGLIDDGYLNIEQRIEGFLYFLFGIIMPSNQYPEHAILSSYMQQHIGAGGGGLIANYFYVWLGWIGPLLAGALIGLGVKQLYVSRLFYLRIYAILILICFPRWYAYSPINLTKFCIIGIFFLALLYSGASVINWVSQQKLSRKREKTFK
jgi:hypothetical protein